MRAQKAFFRFIINFLGGLFMKNEYTVTSKMYAGWLSESGFHGRGLYLCISFCSLAVLSVLMVLTHPFEPYSVFYIIAAVACLYMAFLKNGITARQQYKSILAISEGGEWKRSVSFEEDFVLVDDGFADDSAMKIPYENITCVRQKNGVYTLYIRGGGVICLYDDCFTEGDWEQCKAQLSAKNPKIKFK